RLVQRIVALSEVQHRVVEPFLLMLGGGFQHAAAQDVREQLVAGLLERAGGGHFAWFRTLLGHAWGTPLCIFGAGTRAHGRRLGSLEAADQSAPQCNRALCSTQRPTTAAGNGIIMDGEGVGRWTHQGRRAHERSLGRSVRTGPGGAPARHAARAGGAHSGAGPNGSTARASAGAPEAPGERAERAVSL